MTQHAIHRRFYNWLLSLAHSKYATTALCVLSFAEASFFPMPPDLLQITLTLEHRNRAWYYATLNSIFSVLGGLFGYFIGRVAWGLTSDFFFKYVFSEQTFHYVGQLYETWNFWIVFVAAFTPIPYKIITIAAGVFHISLPYFILASVLGRSARFFLVAWLLWHYGATIKKFIDRYFNLITFAVLAILILVVILIELL